MQIPRNIDQIRQQLESEFGLKLITVDEFGARTSGSCNADGCDCCPQLKSRRLEAVKHTRYWGEPIINLCCDSGYAMWGIPVLDNNELIGGLIVQGIDLDGKSPEQHQVIQEAAAKTLQWAIEYNLINEAEVKLARQRALNERDKFLAIEDSKERFIADDMRSIYLYEEPELLSAIKQGQINEARSILNRILTGIYGIAGDRLELLKSSVLELVVMMSRAAVEAGARPSGVLGSKYRSLSELSAIDDEEDLSEWVRRMLDTLIESIRSNESYPHSLLILKAIRYMEGNLHKQLRRDEVARVAGVSPSHFSKIVTERMGRSFTSLLNQLRVTKAKELLARTENNLSEIAIDCGFCDQSHFNKSFKSETTLSPREYRNQSRLA